MTEVTAEGIRSGEPDALAALCKRRGGAVLVYSEHVAAPGQAADAAADAFAQFRARVFAADEATIDAEALLISATRHAATARGVRAHPANGTQQKADCPAEAMLVDWIEETLSAPDRERFEKHVVDCPTCVGAVARFEAAERAYEHPPLAPLPPKIAQQILGALVAAAPVTALEGDAAAVREAAERDAGVHAPAASPAAVHSVAADTRSPNEPIESAAPTAGATAWQAQPHAPASAADLTFDRPSATSGTPLTPPDIAHNDSPTMRSGAAARAADAGDALIELFRTLGERGRRAAQHRPRLPQARPRLPQGLPRLPQGLPRLPQGLPRLPQGLPRLPRGIGRRPAIGIALGAIVALIITVSALTLGGSSTSSESASSVSDGSPPTLTPADGSQSAVEDQPPAPAKEKPEPKDPQPKPAKTKAERQRSASERSASEARSRRAERRRSAGATPSKQSSSSPSSKPETKKPEAKKPEAKKPEAKKPAPAPPKTPTAKRPSKEPTQAPRPEPVRPKPPSSRPSLGDKAPKQQAPSLGGSKRPPGGEFSVGGET